MSLFETNIQYLSGMINGDMFTKAVNTSMANILLLPSTRPNLTIVRTWGPGTG